MPSEPSIPREITSSPSPASYRPTERVRVPNPTDPSQIAVQQANQPSSPKRRRNPLYVGEVEEDFSVDDSYFNHGGNLSSFLQTYTALHDKLIASQSKRVVVYLPMKETGLGNSLLAISSSFLYAVLTKRAFLLNYGQFTKHFTFPWKEPNSTFTCMLSSPKSFFSFSPPDHRLQPMESALQRDAALG